MIWKLDYEENDQYLGISTNSRLKLYMLMEYYNVW